MVIKMKDIDVRTVDPESLVSLEQVTIPDDLPREDKLHSFIRQIKNPYCYKVGDFVIKLSYAEEGDTIEECLQEYMQRAEK